MTRKEFQFKLRLRKSHFAELIQRYKRKHGEKDAVLFGLVNGVRSRRYVTKDELRSVCRWKSPRSMGHIEKSSEEFVREISGLALSTKDEHVRISVLTLLNGVGWPTASVLLHFFHEDSYPILDFRALWSLTQEKLPPYTFDFWWDYTEFCRSLAKDENLDMRSLDQALWQYSRENQPT